MTSAVGVHDGVTQADASLYWETAAADDVSFFANAWVGNAFTAENDWKEEVTAGFKRALVRTDAGAMAVQAAALWVSEPPAHCSEGGAELRWLGGANVGRHAFVNLEVAERALAGGCAESRFEISGGYRPARQWLGLVQVFTDDPDWGDMSVKAQVSLVRFEPDERRGLQIGLRTRLDGDEGVALVVGLWSRPGRR